MDKNDSSWIFFPLFFLSVNVQWLCRCRCHSCPGQGRPTLGWWRSSWRSGSWDLCWPSPLSDPLPNSTASKGRSWTAPSHVRHCFNYSVLHVYDSAVDQFYWDCIDTKCRGVINADVYYGCTSRAVLFFSFFFLDLLWFPGYFSLLRWLLEGTLLLENFTQFLTFSICTSWVPEPQKELVTVPRLVYFNCTLLLSFLRSRLKCFMWGFNWQVWQSEPQYLHGNQL